MRVKIKNVKAPLTATGFATEVDLELRFVDGTVWSSGRRVVLTLEPREARRLGKRLLQFSTRTDTVEEDEE